VHGDVEGTAGLAAETPVSTVVVSTKCSCPQVDFAKTKVSAAVNPFAILPGEVTRERYIWNPEAVTA